MPNAISNLTVSNIEEISLRNTVSSYVMLLSNGLTPVEACRSIHASVSATKKFLFTSNKSLAFPIPLLTSTGVGITTVSAAVTPLVMISIISSDRVVRVVVVGTLVVNKSRTFLFKKDTA